MIFIVPPYFPRVENTPPILLEAQDNVLPDLQVGVEVNPTYTYFHTLGVPEDNLPITADDVVISGTPEIGSAFTANIVNLYIQNGSSAGSHQYRWYRCNNTRSNGDLIVGATGSSYTLTNSEDGKFIRCEITLVQSSGGNLTGTILYSSYSDRVSGAAFNPIVDLNWDTSWIRNDLPEFATTGIWANSSLGSDADQDGSANLPVYNSGMGALEFTRASSQRLKFTNQSQTQPFIGYIRFRLKSLTGTQYLIGWTSSIYLSINSGGDLVVCGAVVDTNFVIDTWYELRFHIQGTSTVVTIDNGTPINVTSGVAVSGTGGATGQIGASHATTPANHLNGFISDIFLADDETTDAGHVTDMFTWL